MAKNDSRARSWFAVLNNPEEHGYSGSPKEICDEICNEFVDSGKDRSCACSYCISADGLHHCHIVYEAKNPLRFSSLKKKYPSVHFEETKGSASQAMNYVLKQGSFAEKGEVVKDYTILGEISGKQGKRSDLNEIEELINEGLSPSEIFDIKFSYRRYSKEIKDAYFDKRLKETPRHRHVEVVVHCGDTGSGKSYSQLDLPFDDLFKITDYKNPFDDYAGEKYVFVDEFRGQIPYNYMLLATDNYVSKLPARYHSAFSLWERIEISSIIPPEDWYNPENVRDTLSQLYRRIDTIIFHVKLGDVYDEFTLPYSEYCGYEDLVKKANAFFAKKYKLPEDFLLEWDDLSEKQLAYIKKKRTKELEKCAKVKG